MFQELRFPLNIWAILWLKCDPCTVNKQVNKYRLHGYYSVRMNNNQLTKIPINHVFSIFYSNIVFLNMQFVGKSKKGRIPYETGRPREKLEEEMVCS